MTQNTSHAVMAQRHEAHDSLDDFPTPPWATRALIEHVLARHVPLSVLKEQSVWEPACNRGHMVRPLREYFRRVDASDIHDYSTDCDPLLMQDRVVDFLWPRSESPFQFAHPPVWVITNPPFRLAEQFIARAFEVSHGNVAVIVRTAFLESVGRYNQLFLPNPPDIVAQFAERVVMIKGRLTATGSTATSYCWLVWLNFRPGGTRFCWIPPCRAALEREDDYGII